MIKDWQRYKQLENEKNADSQEERLRLAKRLAMTCRTDDIDKDTLSQANAQAGASGSSSKAGASSGVAAQSSMDAELLEDEFFQEYLRKRIEEMQKKSLAL